MTQVQGRKETLENLVSSLYEGRIKNFTFKGQGLGLSEGEFYRIFQPPYTFEYDDFKTKRKGKVYVGKTFEQIFETLERNCPGLVRHYRTIHVTYYIENGTYILDSVVGKSKDVCTNEEPDDIDFEEDFEPEDEEPPEDWGDEEEPESDDEIDYDDDFEEGDEY
jgi:hypothetical protein